MNGKNKLIDLNKDVTLGLCGMYRTGHHFIGQSITKNLKLNTILHQQPNFIKNYNQDCIQKGHSNNIYIHDIENPSHNRLARNKLDIYILIIRDPMNNYASIKKSKHITWSLKKWKQHYHNMIEAYETNVFDLVIIYDKFISDEEYRKTILSQLSCEQHSKVNQVTLDGWGSSFSRYNKSSVKELLSRYLYLNENEINEIKNDKRIYEFYYR